MPKSKLYVYLECVIGKNDKGDFHREDGPAIDYSNGHKCWYLNGLLHREDGPAHENANGDKRWYLNGLLHRVDGPAIEHANGNKDWFLNGDHYTEEDYNEKIKSLRLS